MTHTLSTYSEGQKKQKGVRWLAQEAQPSDLYPYARKSDTHGYKKNHQKLAKNSLLCSKIQPAHRKELILLINSVLEDILVYHLRLKENFVFFFEKKISKKYKC